MRFRLLALLSILVLAFGPVGCSNDDDGDNNGATDMSADRSPDRGADTTVPDTTTDAPTVDTQPDTSVDPGVDPGFDPGVDTGIDQGGEECGAIDYAGLCEGDVVKWCDNDGVLQTVDCAAMYGEYDLEATCGFIDASFGYWCVLEVGQPCLFQDSDGNPVPDFCDGTDAGCVVDEEFAAACTADVGPCTMTDNSGTPGEACVGNLAVLLCLINQPFGVDCAAFGGTCNTTDGTCIGIPSGGTCDDELLLCDAGLTCNIPTDESSGTCE